MTCLRVLAILAILTGFVLVATIAADPVPALVFLAAFVLLSIPNFLPRRGRGVS